MGYGLIDVARDTRQQAMQGLSDVSNREIQRESSNQQLKMQQQQGKMSMVGVGAGTGLAMGGPLGAGIGAAVGLLAGSIF
ncbi:MULTISPECIES: bacteriocin [Yersinia]|uniref:bacteriocin n=1 Tax=Yersinia TaxID=629 RepID=UPI0011A8D380|nr:MULTISPECIES: bacteriocin [Yersinia]MBS0056972.1 bacteriocin [Yersinia sp. Marseille-Q3913]